MDRVKWFFRVEMFIPANGKMVKVTAKVVCSILMAEFTRVKFGTVRKMVSVVLLVNRVSISVISSRVSSKAKEN
jgi:hypothetical protein